MDKAAAKPLRIRAVFAVCQGEILKVWLKRVFRKALKDLDTLLFLKDQEIIRVTRITEGKTPILHVIAIEGFRL